MVQNPFPGMNPWLESRWGDVHTRLTTYACDQLQPKLPAGLRAQIEEYLAVSDEDSHAEPRRYSPDVQVIGQSGSGVAVAVETEAVVAEPVRVPRNYREPQTLHRIEIVESGGKRIVTSIEFLSQANKTNKTNKQGRKEYRRKQADMLEAGVNLVEIDLIRKGAWVLAVPEESVPAKCRVPYRIAVVRAIDQGYDEVYPVPLQQPLPSIRIPLRPDDADVVLQLQPLMDAAFINGAYGDAIDYENEPKPKLRGADAKWADQRLREQGLR